MKTEGPIIMQVEMVRAILAVLKTETRRVMMPQPSAKVSRVEKRLGGWWGVDRFGGPIELHRCRYDKDRLWVREFWRTCESLDAMNPRMIAEKCLDAGYLDPWAPLLYKADQRRVNWEDSSPGKGRPSIHMPRWASRIDLEVVEIRAERLQAIDAEGAIAEGTPSVTGDPVVDFKILWDRINDDRGFGWEKNPWLWVIRFARVWDDRRSP